MQNIAKSKFKFNSKSGCADPSTRANKAINQTAESKREEGRRAVTIGHCDFVKASLKLPLIAIVVKNKIPPKVKTET